MHDILHRVGIKAPPSHVYAALSTVEGVAGWWTRETSGRSTLGGTLSARFLSPAGEEIGKMSMEVVALDRDKTVHWRFKSGPDEWIGTDATFELHQDGNYTIVVFGHRHWREAGEFMAHCSTKWATFMLSLKALVEQGTGSPSPQDIKIDNWN